MTRVSFDPNQIIDHAVKLLEERNSKALSCLKHPLFPVVTYSRVDAGTYIERTEQKIKIGMSGDDAVLLNGRVKSASEILARQLETIVAEQYENEMLKSPRAFETKALRFASGSSDLGERQHTAQSSDSLASDDESQGSSGNRESSRSGSPIPALLQHGVTDYPVLFYCRSGLREAARSDADKLLKKLGQMAEQRPEVAQVFRKEKRGLLFVNRSDDECLSTIMELREALRPAITQDFVVGTERTLGIGALKHNLAADQSSSDQPPDHLMA